MIKSDKSTGANSFENAVGVRLYFTDAEFQDLAYWTNYVASTATGQTANCAYDDTVSNINSIYVTKYTGINEDEIMAIMHQRLQAIQGVWQKCLLPRATAR